MPRNLLLNLKRKKKKNPLPVQKNFKNKKPKVIKGKEYKIWRPKQRTAIRKCSLCSENFSFQKELNDHIAVHHKYKFLYSDRKCGKTFGSANSPKKHKLHHGEMTFQCQACGAKFPFASDLSYHQALHLQEKKIVHIQNVVESIKQSQSLITIITTDPYKNHPRQPLMDVLFVRKHFKEPNI